MSGDCQTIAAFGKESLDILIWCWGPPAPLQAILGNFPRIWGLLLPLLGISC